MATTRKSEVSAIRIVPAVRNTIMHCFVLIATILCTATALADTATWRSDVYSGSWTNAANWTGGILPDEKISASLENSGADYTVTIDSDSMLYATNTFIKNTSGTTTLYVDSPITFFPGAAAVPDINNGAIFYQYTGAKTFVRSGGRMIFDGPATCSGIFWIENSTFTVDGGELDFNGGNRMFIRGTSTNPATIDVTNNGAFAFHYNGTSSSHTFEFGSNTRLNVHNGRFTIAQNRSFGQTNPFSLNGGQIYASGTGVFEGLYRTDNYSSLVLKSGSAAFSDNAFLNCTAILMAPPADNKTMTVSFDGNSTISNGYVYAKTIIGDSHGRSIFNWNSSANAQIRTAYIGFNRGYGELNINRGFMSAGERYGLFVGKAWGSSNNNETLRNWGGNAIDDPAQFAPTGVVRVAGGVLRVDPIYATSTYTGHQKQVNGLIIGDGAMNYDEYSDRPCYGMLEISGGSVTNLRGNVVVGYGHSVGRIVQTGGEFVKNYTAAQATVIGLAGGDGALVISNGVHTSNISPIFVGGAALADLGVANETKTAGNYPKGARNAEGVLTLACHDKTKACTLKVTNIAAASGAGVWVGRDGDGTVEIIGSGSTLDVQNTGLILTNGFTVANGETETPGELLTHGQATLRFVFDADGVGQIDSRNKPVAIAPNVKLEVDMSAYAGEEKTVTLIRRKDSTGGQFNPANMTLKKCKIIQDETAIRAKYYIPGLAIVVK